MNSAPNFNRLAGPYRWMERLSFGPFLALCRSTYLNRAVSRGHALILGDGDGRFTARLLRADPRIEIDAVDASSAMLQSLTRRAAPHATRLRTHRADVRVWSPANTRRPGANWDLIVTHFFLDCLTTSEIQDFATRLRPFIAPNSLWIVSEFAVPSGRYSRLVAMPLIRLLYAAFGLLTGLSVRTLPDHHAALLAAGYSLVETRPRLAGLLVSEVWALTPFDQR